MSRTHPHSRSWLSQHWRQLCLSLEELWLTPLTSIMSILVLGFSLSLPALLLAFANNAGKIEQQWQHSAQINLFLALDTTAEQEQQLLQQLQQMPELLAVNYQSAAESLVEFQAHSGFADALAYLDNNPLPALIFVIPNIAYEDDLALHALQKRLQALPEVELARLDMDWLKRLEALSATARMAGMALTGLLVLAVVLITANTIRLGIMQRYQEIKVMKLVGATEAFIRRPFLYSGVWLGFMAAMICLVIVNGLLLWLDRVMAQLMSLYQSQLVIEGLSLAQVVWLFGISCGLGWLGAYLSVRQHMRAIEPQ
ncbi:MAG: permease-like cell division protein FtsX [Ferrimonas sp.]